MRKVRTINAFIALLAFATVVSVSVYAADPKPDFNGTWKIDLDATAKANGKAAPAGRGMTLRIATEGAQQVRETVTLVQDEKSLVVKGAGRDVVWTLDGSTKKGEQETRGGKMDIAMKAKWDGAKIVTSTDQKTMSTGELHETEYKETWAIDKGGKLNFTLDVSTGRGSYKAVYNKE